MLRRFALLSAYAAHSLGLTTAWDELAPDEGLPGLERLAALRAAAGAVIEDEAEPGAELPTADAAEETWRLGWRAAVAVQIEGEPSELGEAWLVRALPEAGPHPELPEGRDDAEGRSSPASAPSSASLVGRFQVRRALDEA